MHVLTWDIFCKVIDNYGDIGVCWRLSRQLAQRGQRVRLWADDCAALSWMASEPVTGVQVLHWQAHTPMPEPGDVLIEAFGCDPDPRLMAAHVARVRAGAKPPVWINLEYLSAERFAQQAHALPSPVLSGPGQGWTKYFFYPGFTPGSGGLLREPDLLTRQCSFERSAWLQSQGIAWQGEHLLSLFCYEPPALAALLDALAQGAQATRMLVTAGRASAAVSKALGLRVQPGQEHRRGALRLNFLPLVAQDEFDPLLWACDLNLVRGEDSLVRALWAARMNAGQLQAVPCIWQIYPQHDGAHHAKLQAFLDWLAAPDTLRQAYAAWNDLPGTAAPRDPVSWAAPAPTWLACAHSARQHLLEQEDLTSQLLRMACTQAQACERIECAPV